MLKYMLLHYVENQLIYVLLWNQRKEGINSSCSQTCNHKITSTLAISDVPCLYVFLNGGGGGYFKGYHITFPKVLLFYLELIMQFS